MKLILSIGLVIIASVAYSHHEDDDSHPCAQGLYQLGKDETACLGDFQRWYHDHSSGECKEFSWDGCKKNENNFESKEECDKTCKEWHEIHKDHHHGSHKHTADCKHDEHDHHHGHEHHHH